MDGGVRHVFIFIIPLFPTPWYTCTCSTFVDTLWIEINVMSISLIRIYYDCSKVIHAI